MTNAEKYLKGITPYEFAREYGLYCYNYERGMTGSPADKIGRFLKAEVTPTLTEDEKVILKNIDIKTFKTIGRRKSGGLYVRFIFQDETYNANIFNDNLFQFIKERRRIFY